MDKLEDWQVKEANEEGIRSSRMIGLFFLILIILAAISLGVMLFWYWSL